jgi:hypothetical protein
MGIGEVWTPSTGGVMITNLKEGDMVRAINDCPMGTFKKGDIGIIMDEHKHTRYWFVDFGYYDGRAVDSCEIELIDVEEP